jgi:cyclic-di-GMP phosphodiesterase TipF (flagellum assembly factor)
LGTALLALSAPLAAIASLPGQAFGLGTQFLVLSGAFLFLFVLNVCGAIRRGRKTRALEGEVAKLRASNATIRFALDGARKYMAEVTTALARKSEAQEKKLVGELQMIESLIRGFTVSAAKTAEAPREAEAPQKAMAGLADPAMLDVIRHALEENRVELHLQPMLTLPQRRVRFYEALSRLRSEDGAIIMPAQYIRVAATAGLMSTVDNLLLLRCVQLVRRLAQKNRDIGVFCNISGHTLSDTEFFPQFFDFLSRHRDLAGHIVFEFAQGFILRAGAAEEANLRRLAGLGFHFSMDQATDLDLDFAKLRRLGFTYLKVRADILLSGMKDANAAVTAEDFKDLLARNGISLIAERIEDEKTVLQLLDYNVGFGQGYLFGRPRPVREFSEAEEPVAAPTAESRPIRSRAG